MTKEELIQFCIDIDKMTMEEQEIAERLGEGKSIEVKKMFNSHAMSMGLGMQRVKNKLMEKLI